MSSRPSVISKTSFLKFDQCAKAFFLYKKHPHLRDAVSKEKQLTFNRGHLVGKLAQQLFPGGIDVTVPKTNLEEAIRLTKELIEKKQPVIYEATFVFNEVLVMVDILVLDENGYTAYEVKSSLKVSDVYVKDACLQYYVLRNSLKEMNDFFLVTINGDYVLGSELNVRSFFKKRSIKQEAEKNIEFFEHKIAEMLLTLEKDSIPNIPIGKHCFSPYPCDFLGTCWKNTQQERSVFNIGQTDRDLLFSWYEAGIFTVDDIKETDDLKPRIKIQIESIKSDQEYFNKDAILDFMGSVKAPCAFLDMEIWSPAIPKYEGTRPFEQIPFLFSLCTLKGKEPVCVSYIKPIEQDGREEFLIEILKATEAFDSIIAYDKNLETGILNQLAKLFPQYTAKVRSLNARMLDISEMINRFHYYHPKLKGNFSLKAVSEIVYPELKFSEQPISSGLVAMNIYESLLEESNPILAEEVKQKLISYCNMDTLTCLKFFKYLEERIKEW